MANSVSHGSLPYPIKNARYSILVPYLDADGDPTDPTTPDTELSGDAGAFADCAEEVTTITGSNGTGYITLTGAETNYSIVAVCAKVASGPKATLATLYPRNLPILESGTAGAGAAGTITLASGTYTGLNLANCFIRTTGGTGGGGTGGANNQARRITSYNTSTRVATVTPNWETTPDNTTTYDILLPEGVLVSMLTALRPTTLATTLDVNSNGEAGLDWGNIGNKTTTNALTGTTIATTQQVDLNTIKTQTVTCSGGVTIPAATLASTTNITAGTMTTTTNVTNGVNVTSWNSVSLATTNPLPNAAAGASGGLLISGSNAGTTTFAALTISGTTTFTGAIAATNASNDLRGILLQATQTGVTIPTVTNITNSVVAGSLATQAKADVNAEVDTALADAGVTTARMGYVDNLNIGGNVASSTEVVSIQNNTRVVRVVPDIIERPDSGTTTYRIELMLYDSLGNMEAPDSAPTIALVNQGGTDRSSRLDSTTMSLVSTGRYRAIYTADAADTLEQLVWAFSVVEGGATRIYGNSSLIVDTTAVDFTSADRTKLETLATDLTTARAAKLDNLDVASSTLATAANLAAAKTVVDNIKLKTDNLPASPAATGDIPSAATVASAVRTELATELSRIDVASSTLQVSIWSSAGATVNLSGTTVKAVTDTVLADIVKLNNSTPAAQLLSLAYAGFETGTAQGGGASSIQLRAGASSTDGIFDKQVVYVMSGTGAGQTNKVTTYDGDTRTATVETPWVVQPDNTSVYVLLGRVN